jgi:hypothetical protein
VRILRYGTIERWNYMFTCHKCIAHLAADQNDVKHRTDLRHAMPGTRWVDVFYVTCPICTAVTDLDPKAVPTYLLQKLVGSRREEKP